VHSSGKRTYVNGGRCSWAGTSACWLPFQTSASSPYAYSKYDSLPAEKLPTAVIRMVSSRQLKFLRRLCCSYSFPSSTSCAARSGCRMEWNCRCFDSH